MAGEAIFFKLREVKPSTFCKLLSIVIAR